MYQKNKAEVQILLVLLLTTLALILLSTVIGPNTRPLTVAAQGPIGHTPTPLSISEESLAAFGLISTTIQSSTGPFDLKVDLSADKTAVGNDDTIKFMVTITNLGPNSADYILFKNSFSTTMNNVTYQFSVPEAISNGETIPTWLLPGSIPKNGTVAITITGKIVSSKCDIKSTDTAQAFPWYSNADVVTGNNVASLTIDVIGQFKCVFLPIVRSEPTPTPSALFFDNFSDDDSGWLKKNDGNCDSSYDGGRYRLDVDKNEICWRPAPDEAEYTYGIFETEGYHSDHKSDAGYGIYINGEGGDNYYLFRIWPNNSCGSGGDWQLIRRKSGDSDTILEGDCHSAIRRGISSSATNVLKIKHTSDRKLSVYVNGTLLGTVTDSSSKHRTGEGTGVYVYSSDEDIVIKYTYFKVSPP